MIALPKLLTLLTAVKIASAGNDYSSIIIADRCQNTPDFDWTKSVNAYLRKIPDSIPLPGPPNWSLIPGVKFGTLKVTGLGDLWSYKPYTSYCVGNKTYIEAHVFADTPLRLSVEWKTCSGHHGEFGTRVSSSSLRLIFIAVPQENRVGVALLTLLPDSLEDPALFIEGGGQWLRTATSITNVIIMPHLEQLWSRLLRVDFTSLIRENVKI